MDSAFEHRVGACRSRSFDALPAEPGGDRPVTELQLRAELREVRVQHLIRAAEGARRARDRAVRGLQDGEADGGAEAEDNLLLWLGQLEGAEHQGLRNGYALLGNV